MPESRIETAKGLCVVALTRYIMNTYDLAQDAAYEKLLNTELYILLMDTGTRLFLETNEYLCRCCEIELTEGIDALYQFINDETMDI